ncbi:efflux RND transporter periplasmic adaptor subunit [Zavarzinia sp.]|uniref:efflux RND transporter periplasmic adaptor subunit n=1 Tax=Zavarzinia sp. TaxID=2027920 RepID=UPI003566D73F
MTLLLAALAGSFPALAETAPAKPPAATVPVTVAAATRGSFPVMLDALGTVQALNTVVVRTRVDGEIQEVAFEEGQTVKRGDLLIRLDSRALQAALDQAKAKRAQDAAALRNVQIDLERIAQLAKQSYASQQQLDAQQAAVAGAQALVQADDAAIENAEVQLSYTEIRAPIDGRIGFRLVDSGNIVRASDQQAMLSIVQTDPITVVFTLPETRVFEVNQSITEGRALGVAAYSIDRAMKLAEGKLSVINNAVDAASGTVQLKALFANQGLTLWPGQSVAVSLHVRDIEDAVIVPAAAVQRGQNGLYAWVVGEGNVVKIRPVTVLMEADGRSVVSTGLQGGEKVVTFGQYRLRDGIAVDPKEEPAADDQGAAR